LPGYHGAIDAFSILLSLARALLRSRQQLLLENMALRQQVAVLRRGVKRPKLNDQDRIFWITMLRLLDTWREALHIVQPDTIIRWHRKLIAMKWTYETKRVGRPGLMKAIKALIVRMATDNSNWGYCRIQGELKGIGHTVAPTTIANVLKENGIKPAPDRPSSWRTFLKAHWGQIAATDFFSAEVWTPRGLTTFYVLFIIDLKTRRAHLAGITTNPDEAFMAQIARNLTDAFDGFLTGHRILILDRDGKFTPGFKRTLKDAGTASILTPRQAPNCNAYAERFVLSIKSECLNRMMIFGEVGLRRAVTGFIEHDHVERPHQGLGNEVIDGQTSVGHGDVKCTERLGGILKHYHRAA